MISVRRINSLIRKELYIRFRSPSLYIFSAFFIFFCSSWFFYFRGFFLMNRAEFDAYFSVFPAAFTLFFPALCMTSWVEEKRNGTDEVLLSLPFSEWELVLGKYFSLLIQLLFIITLSTAVPLSTWMLGDFAAGPLLAQYIGTFLLGASVLAAGLFVSIISSSQASAYFVSLFMILALQSTHRITLVIKLPDLISKAAAFMSLGYHFELFMRALLNIGSILFYLLFISFFLFLTSKTLLFRKWSQV